MKKIFLFLAVASVFTLASCKKDRVCTCTTTSTEPGYGSDVDKVTYLDSKKHDASLFCVSTKEDYDSYPSGDTYTRTETCELK